MKYEEYRKTLKDFELQAVDTIFSYKGKTYDEIFSLCCELAEILENIKEEDIEFTANALSKVPYSYASFSLILAKKNNQKHVEILNKVLRSLNDIYLNEYNSSISKKALKFALFKQKDVEKYECGKIRLIDEAEIIKLCKLTGVEVNDVIGEYKGEDKTTKILNDAMKRIRKFNVNDMEKCYKITINSINCAINNLNFNKKLEI